MVLLGGIIGKRDIPVLEAMGVAQVFLPGTPPDRIVQFIERTDLKQNSELKGSGEMIIDVHRHLVLKGTVQGAYIKGASRSFSMMYNKAHKTNVSPREYVDEIMRKEVDQHADNVIEEMDRSGVEVSVTFAVDYGLAFGEAPIHIFDQNKLYAEIAQRHKGRMIPLIAIDPRRQGGPKHCDQAYHEWGMKGFKLHAGVGYMPDDPVCNWVYEKATDWQVPIMCHTGGAPTSRCAGRTRGPHISLRRRHVTRM